MTELVVVIVIATILSAFAISRINTTSFKTEGYSRQVAAAIRYAQKIAVSQRRNVTVTFTAGAVALSYPDFGQPVRQPPTPDAFSVDVPSGVSLSGTLAGTTLTFSALGKPNTGGTLKVSGGDIPDITITVESETGYVH